MWRAVSHALLRYGSTLKVGKIRKVLTRRPLHPETPAAGALPFLKQVAEEGVCRDER
ncbi:hypothetical protein Adi01nite_60900 [Amorphoplanes digitatis]|nr:hypothetical protein Adi01nite_60900 [Actinoplanes digitatis]